MYQTVPGRLLFNHQFGSYLETCPYRIKIVAVTVIVLFDRNIIATDGWIIYDGHHVYSITYLMWIYYHRGEGSKITTTNRHE
jgi:hypothetical protein